MRSFLLIGFLVCCFFHFRSSSERASNVDHDDSLKTTLSAIKRMPMAKRALPVREVSTVAATEVSRSPELDTPEEEYEETFAETDQEQNIPWNDIEEGWKTELKNYLTTADPENADEIYSAYVEEKKKFAERVDTNESQLNSQGPSFDETGMGEDLEKTHQQNLKELFGEHYSEIQSLHQEYVESIQYINRSEVPFTIAL